MLKAGFILLAVILFLVLLWGCDRVGAKAYTRVSEQKNFRIRCAMVLVVWLAYITGISLTCVFTIVSMPPRIPLLLVFPAFLLFLYFFTGRKFKKFIEATPAALPVYIQSFRIAVELLILSLFLNGLLPVSATFEGYNFDVVIGITAPVMGFLVAKGLVHRAIVLLWNIAGLTTLLIVVVILLTQAYFPSAWHSNQSTLPKALGVFPFTLLAGFFMPVAVFLHVLSLFRVAKKK